MNNSTQYIIEELGRRQAARESKFQLTQMGQHQFQEFLETELRSILGHDEFKVWLVPTMETQTRMGQPIIKIEETRTITVDMSL